MLHIFCVRISSQLREIYEKENKKIENVENILNYIECKEESFSILKTSMQKWNDFFSSLWRLVLFNFLTRPP